MSASTPSLRQRLHLVVQGKTTMVSRGVPVIAANFNDISDCVDAINFLRCGCPAVQVVGHDSAGTVGKFLRNLQSLQMPNEHFDAEWQDPQDERGDENTSYDQLVLLTRKLTPLF